MLHGKGKGNYTEGDQLWMTQESEDYRRKGLLDRTKLTAAERLLYEISGAQGGGMTNYKTYEFKQNPFPTRNKKTIDIRKVDPRIGEMSD